MPADKAFYNDHIEKISEACTQSTDQISAQGKHRKRSHVGCCNELAKTGGCVPLTRSMSGVVFFFFFWCVWRRYAQACILSGATVHCRLHTAALVQSLIKQ